MSSPTTLVIIKCQWRINASGCPHSSCPALDCNGTVPFACFINISSLKCLQIELIVFQTTTLISLYLSIPPSYAHPSALDNHKSIPMSPLELRLASFQTALCLLLESPLYSAKLLAIERQSKVSHCSQNKTQMP